MAKSAILLLICLIINVAVFAILKGHLSTHVSKFVKEFCIHAGKEHSDDVEWDLEAVLRVLVSGICFMKIKSTLNNLVVRYWKTEQRSPKLCDSLHQTALKSIVPCRFVQHFWLKCGKTGSDRSQRLPSHTILSPEFLYYSRHDAPKFVKGISVLILAFLHNKRQKFCNIRSSIWRQVHSAVK